MRRTSLTVSGGGSSRSFVVRAEAGHPLGPVVIAAALAAAIAGLAGRLAPAPTAAALVALGVSWLLGRRFVVCEESLTAIEGSGLQLCTRRVSGRETERFIEAAAISAIFLAEAVRVDRCHFYLACLLHGEELVVPFRHLLPPLHDLQCVYRGVWAVLWPSQSVAACDCAASTPSEAPRARRGASRERTE